MERKSNSLINNNVLPPFASLKTKDMFKAIKYLVGENKKTISSLENKKNVRKYTGPEVLQFQYRKWDSDYQNHPRYYEDFEEPHSFL